jgi:two-component system, OmpR family, alkaline phosphatase synthesis response regulator PhoP
VIAHPLTPMSPPTILVIEDDAAIRRGLCDALRFAGFLVIDAPDGATGRTSALHATYDLMLLDLVLPHGSGFEILETMKRHRPGTPVIILSARGEENDKVKGLKLGADDYVVKPFSVRELLARVNAVLRRSPERPQPVEVVSFPHGRADLARREVQLADGERIELSERETELLRYLAAHRGRALSREEILQRVWRLDAKGLATRTIDMHVASLRQKLRDDANEPAFLLTVRGKGYMLAQAGD